MPAAMIVASDALMVPLVPRHDRHETAAHAGWAHAGMGTARPWADPNDLDEEITDETDDESHHGRSDRGCRGDSCGLIRLLVLLGDASDRSCHCAPS